MTEILLGSFFDQPVHVASWRRPASGAGLDDYRVTNPFTGPDLINKGQVHGAVDVGDGQGSPQPLLAPRTCLARGLYHWDGAIGMEFALAPGISAIAWHLSRTLPVATVAGRAAKGAWANVTKGRQYGLTGNTGKQPMPYHTHLELWIGSRRVDIEPHLPLVERAARPIVIPEEDDMQLPSGAGYLASGKIGPGNRLRISHETTAGSEVLEEVTAVDVIGIVPDGTPYTLTDGRKGDRWYIVRRGDTGDVRQVAHLLVTGIEPTPWLFSQVPLPAADCSVPEGKLRLGRTAIVGALQAHAAEGRALSAAAESIR